MFTNGINGTGNVLSNYVISIERSDQADLANLIAFLHYFAVTG